MKKIALLFLLVFCLATPSFALFGRHSDREWTIEQMDVSASSVVATANQSGMLRVWNIGADAYIAFGPTADATDIIIENKSSIDFYPASITNGSIFSVYCASATSINYVILD